MRIPTSHGLFPSILIISLASCRSVGAVGALGLVHLEQEGSQDSCSESDPSPPGWGLASCSILSTSLRTSETSHTPALKSTTPGKMSPHLPLCDFPSTFLFDPLRSCFRFSFPKRQRVCRIPLSTFFMPRINTTSCCIQLKDC